MDILAGGVIVNITITSLFNQIVPRYFLELNSFAVIVDEKPLTSLYQDYIDGIEIFFSTESSPPVFWISVENSLNGEDLEEKILLATELGCQGYIVASGKVVNFISSKFQVVQISLQRQRDKYFIFLLDDPYGNTTEEILHHEAMKIFPGHLIVKSSNDLNGFELITQKFVSNYENEKGILLDYLPKNESYDGSIDLFPDKMKNLQGRDVPMGTFTYLPYLKLDNVPPGEGNIDELHSNEAKTLFIDGTEAKMMMEFGLIRNFTIKIKQFPPDSWGNIYENGTSDGVYGSLYEKKIDVGFACLSSQWYPNECDYSVAVAKTSILLLVPAAEILPLALTPTLPFTPNLWLIILLTLFFGIIVYYLIEWRITKTIGNSGESTFGLAVLRIGAIYLQQSFLESTKWNSKRILLASFLILSVVVGNLYSGGLASVLTVPKYEKSIDTYRQFKESGLKWGAPSYAWIYSLNGVEDPIYKAFVKNFELSNHEKLHQLSRTKSIAFGIERLNSGSYTVGSYIHEDSLENFDMIKEDAYLQWINPNSVRGWPLMEYFNEYGLRIQMYGFWDHWERRSTEKYSTIKAQIALKLFSTGFHAKPGITILKVDHISGPLFLWAVGLSLATLAFFIELAYYYVNKLKLF